MALARRLPKGHQKPHPGERHPGCGGFKSQGLGLFDDFFAAGGAAAVAADAVGVVALFAVGRFAVAAVGADHAANAAFAVAAVVNAVVALLTEADDAVAADRRAFALGGVEAGEGEAEAGALFLALDME